MKTPIAFLHAALMTFAAIVGLAPVSATGAFVPGVNGEVRAIAADGNGNVYAGGLFNGAGAVTVSNIAKFDGTNWSALGSGINGAVNALAVIGTDLYAGGFFTQAGGQPAANIAKWNGATWSALNSGCDSTVAALAVIGTDLFAAGDFNNAGGTVVNQIAKWNGTIWSPLGGGIPTGFVFALAASGNNLYVGGNFPFVDGNAVSASRVARWDNTGMGWSAVGTGSTFQVNALAVINGNLYTGLSGGTTVRKWDGMNWSDLAAPFVGVVQALSVIGMDLFAGGNANEHIKKWDGAMWSLLGTGLAGSEVKALGASGTDLYAGGTFTTAGGVTVSNIAKWDTVMASWSAVGKDVTTDTPTLTAPASNAVIGSPVSVNFTLLEAAKADSVTLTFDGAVTKTLTLANTQGTAGVHGFNFDPADPTASPEVSMGSAIPDGTYTVTLSYKDALDNPAATASSANVRLDTTVVTVSVSALAGPVLKHVPQGAPAPGAGAVDGPPAGTTLGAFFTPAISDSGGVAATATLLAGTKKLTAIYLESGAGVGTLAAFQGKQADGLAAGVTFKSFLHPLLAPDGTVAFGAKVKGLKATEDEGVWTDALGGGLKPILQEGHDVPGLPAGTTLKSVTSISLRNGELIALLTLNNVKGVVTTANNKALVRILAAAANVLLRTGDTTANGAKALAITAFLPGKFSTGQGRTHADGGVVVRVKTDIGGDQIVSIADDGTRRVQLATSAVNPDLNAQATKLSLPDAAGTGTTAKISAKFPPATASVETVIFTVDNNTAFSHSLRVGQTIPGGGATFKSIADPVMNDKPRAVFLATIAGATIKAPANTAFFEWKSNYDTDEIVRAGSAATGADGAVLADTTWKTFNNYALPDGINAGLVFIATVTGKAVTAKNKLGLWAEDRTGTFRQLLRGDQTVTVAPGVTKKLASFRSLDALPGSFGSRRSYNSTRSVAVLATFTDKTQAILRLKNP